MKPPDSPPVDGPAAQGAGSRPVAALSQGVILAVDDTPASLRLLTDLLKDQGYEVRSAISGALALRAAAARPPELILLDVSMPDLSGFEVCRRLKEQPQTRDVPIIFVTAMSETTEKVKGFELGAVDYVTKPFQREELLARVRTHLELHRLQHRLEEMVEARTVALRKSEAELRTSLLESVAAIAATIEMRDLYTAGHQRRVAQLSVAIARELGLAEPRIQGLYLASVVHDGGKVKVPAEILAKPGTLTEPESALLHEHASAGHDILKGIAFPWPIAEIVYQHHERLDGSGYPRGLKGDEVMLEARILAVADVLEAMNSHRPYRAALGIEAALGEIVAQRGLRYDTTVVDAAVRLFRERGYQLQA